jgi:hypothetical protein
MTIRSFYGLFKRAGLLLFCLMLFNRPSLAQEPAPEAQVGFDPRFGIVDSFVNTTEASAAGAGWTRVFFRWDVVQPGGPSDWKPTNVPDTFLDAEIGAGREIAAVLIGTPGWATESGLSTAVPPQEYWGDFVYKIASQYKGRINHWIIWNQPDTNDPTSPSYTWDGTEEDYYRLLKEAYLKIKSVDPAMQVHLAGLTYTWDQERGTPQYLARLLDIITADPQAEAENQFFDVVSYHLYYDPIRMAQSLADIRSILDRYGLGHKPIWINETNAPPTEDYLEPPTGAAGPKITLEEQSAFVIQAFALALAGGAERIAFNKLRNEQAIAPLGLLRTDNSRRPAFDAFQTVTTYFAGTQQADWTQLGSIYVVTLDRGGETTTVLWNSAVTPVNYSLKAIAPQATLVDRWGNGEPITAVDGAYPLELPAAICSNGVNACFIGGVPYLVVEAGAPAQRGPLQPPAEEVAVEPVSLPPPTDTPEAAEPPPSVEPASSPPPTLTPTPAAASQTGAITPTAVVSPTATVAANPPAELPAAPDVDTALPPGALPHALDPVETEGDPAADIEATPALIPPVSISTVLRPARILWLFIIGLVVFVVTYGIQVFVWYRLRR